MRCAQLLLGFAALVGVRVEAQYHQHHNMPRAKFDDVTGAPLNDAARSILQRHAATAPAPGAGAAEAFDSLVDVAVAAGTWKFVMLECELDGRRRRIVRALQGLKYHAENYDVTAAPLKALGVHVRVVGGGRIKRDDAAKTISVTGPVSLKRRLCHRRGACSTAYSRRSTATRRRSAAVPAATRPPPR